MKRDDAGLRLAQSREGPAATFGRGLVRAMPVVMSALSTVGAGRHPARRAGGIEVRGRGVAIVLPTPLIRIHPERIVSWGLETRRSARTVTR